MHGVEQAHGCAVAVGPANRVAFAQRVDGLPLGRPESCQQRHQCGVAQQPGDGEREHVDAVLGEQVGQQRQHPLDPSSGQAPDALLTPPNSCRWCVATASAAHHHRRWREPNPAVGNTRGAHARRRCSCPDGVRGPSARHRPEVPQFPSTRSTGASRCATSTAASFAAGQLSQTRIAVLPGARRRVARWSGDRAKDCHTSARRSRGWRVIRPPELRVLAMRGSPCLTPRPPRRTITPFGLSLPGLLRILKGEKWGLYCGAGRQISDANQRVMLHRGRQSVLGTLSLPQNPRRPR